VRAGAGEGEFIMQPDRLHDGLQFVKTVRALAENVEQQVDLARRGKLQRGHRRTLDSPLPAYGKHEETACLSHQGSNTRKRLPGTIGAISPPLNPSVLSVSQTPLAVS